MFFSGSSMEKPLERPFFVLWVIDKAMTQRNPIPVWGNY